MKLWLVRHAQPLVEKGVCYGASDVPCDPRTLQTAGQALIKQLPLGVSIISSPLQRCEHLAQVLCRLEPGFCYQVDPAITEMNFGDWELKRWDDIAATELQAWTDDFAHHLCGSSGESTLQFVQRVAQRLEHSLRANKDEIWITHAGVIRAVLWLERHQSFRAWMQALLAQPADSLAFPSDLLHDLRAADWPQDAVVWCQVLTWRWPQHSVQPLG
jgi:alpha-ribazole phosphatase